MTDGAAQVHLVVWSDYLCSWCYLGTARLARLEEEFGDALRIEWRAFLLRPTPQESRTLERFRAYTQSWLRPAAEPDAPSFRPSASDAGALAQHPRTPRRQGRRDPRTRRVRGDAPTPLACLLRGKSRRDRPRHAADALVGFGLAEDGFAVVDAPATRAAVLAEHRDALEQGVTGVPAVMMVATTFRRSARCRTRPIDAGLHARSTASERRNCVAVRGAVRICSAGQSADVASA